jgi:methanogenic corrinoid protein MtbC1
MISGAGEWWKETMSQLVEESKRLPHVPPDVVEEYLRQSPRMAEAVSRSLGQRDDLGLLIGAAPVSMMHDNHRHHGAFMADVFLLRATTLLVNMMPWVYRAYSGQGFAYEYFRVELEAWRTVLAETLGQEQAREIVAYYDWLLDKHDDVIRLAEAATPWTPELPGAWQSVYEEFLECLLTADSPRCIAIGREAVGGLEPGPFYLHVVQPALYTVGEMWAEGKVTVAQEHLASTLTARTLASLFVDGIYVPKVRGKVLVTASPNEFHEIGAWMVSSCLEYDGWNVLYLGANTPHEALIRMARAEQPDIIAISMTTPFNFRSIYQLIQDVRAMPELAECRIMVGGQAFGWDESIAEALGADAYTQDCIQAVECARRWWREAGQ